MNEAGTSDQAPSNSRIPARRTYATLFRGLLLAIAVSGLSSGLALLFYGFFRPMPFVPFFPAIVLSALFGGLGPGLLASILCGFVGYYIFLPPPFTFVLDDPADAVGVVLFFVTGVLTAILASALRSARMAAEEAAAARQTERDHARLGWAEATAREAELNALLQAITAEVLVVNSAGEIKYANQVAADVWGYPSAAAMQNLAWSDVAGRWPLFNEAGEAVAVGELPTSLELREQASKPLIVRVARPDRERWLLRRAVAIRNGSGEPRLVIGVGDDITDIKAAQQDKQEFVLAVAHDLKTPLTSIKMTAQLLKRAPPATAWQADDLLPHMKRIEDMTNHLTSQITQFVELGMLEQTGQFTFNMAPVDLSIMLRKLADEYQALHGEPTLRVEYQGGEVITMGDGHRLELAIGNLIANAMKYSPASDEVVLSLTREDTNPRVAVLKVKDAGIGIPAEDAEHIFEASYRASNALVGGSGFGLAYVKEVVSRHGGTISVATQQGVGTEFAIRLPLLASASEPMAELGAADGVEST